MIIYSDGVNSVDEIENNPTLGMTINYYPIEGVLRWCKNSKNKLPLFVYVSTNAVYRGNRPPYREDSPQIPVNKYGEIKKECEHLIRQMYNDYLIIRPFMLFGWNNINGRKNWGSILYERLKNNQETKLVNDVLWQPTYAENCAEIIWHLIENSEAQENYNISSGETMTLFDFGLLLADIFEFDMSLLQPVMSDYFKTIAPRPKDTSFDISKIQKLNIKIKTVQEGLLAMKEELLDV